MLRGSGCRCGGPRRTGRGSGPAAGPVKFRVSWRCRIACRLTGRCARYCRRSRPGRPARRLGRARPPAAGCPAGGPRRTGCRGGVGGGPAGQRGGLVVRARLPQAVQQAGHAPRIVEGHVFRVLVIQPASRHHAHPQRLPGQPHRPQVIDAKYDHSPLIPPRHRVATTHTARSFQLDNRNIDRRNADPSSATYPTSKLTGTSETASSSARLAAMALTRTSSGMAPRQTGNDTQSRSEHPQDHPQSRPEHRNLGAESTSFAPP